MKSSNIFDQLLHSFAFPFKDPEWVKKIAIGFGLSLAVFIVPIVPTLIIAGYGKRIMQRIIIENGDPYLPEWEDWGRLLSDGLKLWGAGIIYSLPVLLLLMIFLGMMMISLLSPLFFIRSNGTFAPEATFTFFAGIALSILFLFLLTILSFAINLFQAPATTHVVAKDRFSAAFQVKEWWPILKKGLGAFVVAILMIMVFSWAGMMAIQILNLTIILIVLYPFLLGFFMFFTLLYSYTFNALAYREGARRLAEEN